MQGGFPKKIKEEVLVACGRHCSICHVFCGLKIEVHHIKQRKDGGADTFENAIGLCFDCHSEMLSYDPKHPKGNRYSEEELKMHRDKWYEKIKNNSGIINDASAIEVDEKVISYICKLLPWDGGIQYVRNTFPSKSYYREEVEDLFRFIGHEINNPELEFIDPDLDGQRVNFINAIVGFQNSVVKNTFPVRDVDGLYAISNEWSHELQLTAIEEMQKEAENMCEQYDKLIRLAKRKLGFVILGDETGKKKEEKKLNYRNGAYWNESGDPFCSRCWDKNKELIRIIPTYKQGNYAQCPECKNSVNYTGQEDVFPEIDPEW